MVLLNKEVLPRFRSQVQLGDKLVIYSEHRYNLGDELRIDGIVAGGSFIGRVIYIKININNKNSYTIRLESPCDWFREAVQNALGGPPGR